METFAFHLMQYQHSTDDAWPFPGDTWDPEAGAAHYQEYFGQLAYAEELGYDGIGFNEHHFSTYGLQPSPVVTGSYMAALTDEVTLAFMGNLLPIRRNPVRVAEEIAMLDNICEGRLISGFPRGIPAEYLAYNVDQDESRDRLAEAWDLVMQTWTAEEPFDHHGEFFDFEGVYAWPRPYQQPHPELWYPAQSEESLRFAAERQVPTGTPGPSAEDLRDTFGRYREIAEEEYGWSPTDEHFSTIRRIYVAETTERAREEAREHLEYQQGQLFAGTHLGVAAREVGDGLYDPDNHERYLEHLPPYLAAAADFDYEAALEEDNVLIGEPEEVAAEIERQYEVSGGFGTLVAEMHFGDLPDELTRRSMELFADEVLPEIDPL